LLVFTERPSEPKRGRPDLARLVRRIQALTFELRELRRAESQPGIHAKKRELEQLTLAAFTVGWASVRE
jgi:hypothetical protein